MCKYGWRQDKIGRDQEQCHEWQDVADAAYDIFGHVNIPFCLFTLQRFMLRKAMCVAFVSEKSSGEVAALGAMTSPHFAHGSLLCSTPCVVHHLMETSYEYPEGVQVRCVTLRMYGGSYLCVISRYLVPNVCTEKQYKNFFESLHVGSTFDKKVLVSLVLFTDIGM